MSESRSASVFEEPGGGAEVEAELDRVNRALQRLGNIDPALIQGDDASWLQEIRRFVVSAGQLAQAARIAHVGYWDRDLLAGIITLSEEACRIFGLPTHFHQAGLEDWQAQWLRLIHPEDHSRVAEAYARALAGGPRYDLEYRLLRADGEVRSVHSCAEVTRDASGKAVRMFGTMLDITERKLAEDQLRRKERSLADSESMLGRIIDSALDAVITTDSEHRIQVFNRSAEATFGYKAAEVVGKSAQILVPHEFRERHLQAMRRIVDQPVTALDMGSGNFRRPICGLRANGEVFPLEASISRIESRGQIVFVLIGRDITERQQATDRLIELNAQLEARVEERTRELEQAKNQAEAASRAKSAFLANMSHEIRTPLNSVLGMAQLALETEMTPKQRDYLEKISLSGNHLLGIISDILDFSKIEAGMLDLEVADFDLGECLDKVSQFCRLRADAKGLALTLALDPAMPRRLRGDGLRVGQVLINLVSNAIKFTERGRVAIRVGPGRAAPMVRFEVEDTGIGIAAEAMAKLFNPFQQADVSTTRKYGGTGLGLAISSQLVSLMGGRIGADSRPEAGSTFWFEIPLAPAESEAPAPAASGSPVASVDNARAGLRGKRILLADDHPFNQDVAAEMLEAVGVAVSVANSGLEAIDLLQRAAVDGVLMDVQMPDLDGYEATRRIRADRRFAALPIIAMTANASKSDREQCLAAGMNDFIAKPVRADLLYAVLLRWLADGERARADTPATAAMPTRPKLIDLAVLARIVGSSDPARLEKFTRKFVESTEAGLGEMAVCLAAGDIGGLARIGHRLKSVARTVGAEGLADSMAAMEALPSGAARADAAALLARSRRHFEQIRRHLAENGGPAAERAP